MTLAVKVALNPNTTDQLTFALFVRLVRHIHVLLFVYFFKELISFIASLDKSHTSVFNYLIINVSILHRFRNKFIQLRRSRLLSILLPGNYICTRSQMSRSLNNPKIDTYLRESKSGPYDGLVNPFPKQALVFTCLQYRSFYLGYFHCTKGNHF